MGDGARDLDGPAPVLAAVGGGNHVLEVQLGGWICPDAEDVHVAMAVGADRAAVERLDLPVVGSRCDLLLRPGVAAIGGGGDHQRGGRGMSLLLASEGGPAHVHVAEERAARRVVRPALLLVAERRRRLLRKHDRRLPGALDASCGGSHVVGPRNGDGLEALEGLFGANRAEVAAQVGVVETRAIGPAELAVGTRDRAEGERRVTIRDQAMLIVPGQCADWSNLGGAGKAGGAHAVPGCPASIGWLCPGCTAIERKIDARDTYSWSERTGCGISGVAGLHVNLFV